MKIREINPQFLFGGSTPEACDCLGLLILNLRNLGYICPWENSHERRFYRFNEMLKLAEKIDMSPCTLDKIVNEKIYSNGAVINYNGLGHVCVVDPDTKKLYNVGASGLAEISPEDYTQVSYYEYTGN